MQEITAMLAEAIARHGTPGASLALNPAQGSFTACAGVTSLAEPRNVSPATVFRLGSMTKALTGCAVMQLIEEGLIGLDEPVVSVLPQFRTADAQASRHITVRHLLNHTAGFFGDCFDDFGEGPEVWERYVDACRDLAQLAPPGSVVSYCNAGFVVLARLTEVLRGRPWDQVVLERVLAPLGMSRSGIRLSLLPKDDFSVSHAPGPDGQLAPLASEWAPLSCAPAGATAWATAGDAAAFGTMLLKNGIGPCGRRILQEETVRLGLSQRVPGPSPTFATAWGLGLMLFNRQATVFGHDGAVGSQSSFLRVVAPDELVFALFVNGGDARSVFEEVFGYVTRRFGSTRIAPAPSLPPAMPDFEPLPYIGHYRSQRYSIDVRAQGAGLVVRFIPAPNAGDFGAPFELALWPETRPPYGSDAPAQLFLGCLPGSTVPGYQRFSRFVDGRAHMLHFRGRIFLRER